MIGRQPIRHTFALSSNHCLGLFIHARLAAAVNIRLDAGRIQHIFESEFGTTDGDIHSTIIENIPQEAKAFVFCAQDILQLGGTARLCTEGLAVKINDLFGCYFEFIIAPIRDFIYQPHVKGK